ncbi:MAG: hypothetical protein ACLRT4_09080 [Thomasclavelia sp.]
MAITVFGLKSGLRLQRKDTYFQYSTSEQFTGMYWIDGKKIYCKTVNIGALNSTRKDVNHGVSSINEIVDVKGIAYVIDSRGAKVWVLFPRAHLDNDHDGISLMVTETLVAVDVGVNNVFSKCYVTIYYTKTTG